MNAKNICLPTEKDMNDKCCELVRNIKALADRDAAHMNRYLDAKGSMMAFFFARDDRGLQAVWTFVAGGKK
jgi:hypothetical protein